MKEVKDVAPMDLLQEKRPWIIAPGAFEPEKGFRCVIIFERHPFRFPLGKLTNMPTDLCPIPYFPADADTAETRHAAEQTATEWSQTAFGIDKERYLAIGMSSISAFERGKFVKVLGETADQLVLENGFGDAIELDEEVAIKLYQDLAKMLDLPCQTNCPECGDIMEGKCSECSPE